MHFFKTSGLVILRFFKQGVVVTKKFSRTNCLFPTLYRFKNKNKEETFQKCTERIKPCIKNKMKGIILYMCLCIMNENNVYE